MQRAICGYHRDDEGHWVADLNCGHSRHVRHDPPWQNRPWVTTPEGRQQFLGTPLDCLKCNMPRLPDHLTATGYIERFQQDTLPAIYLSDHRVVEHWLKIVVQSGKLLYQGQSCVEEYAGFTLEPGFDGIVKPDAQFRLKPLGEVEGCIIYYT